MNIYAVPEDVKSADYKVFRKEFADHVPIDSISLLMQLKKTWANYIHCEGKECLAPMDKKTRRALWQSLGMNETEENRSAGVYGIFFKHPLFQSLGCFYIGMSQADVISRLKDHVNTSQSNDGAKTNKKGPTPYYMERICALKDCYELILCYAKIKKDAKDSTVYFKQTLRLLEYCLTLETRPWFLGMRPYEEEKKKLDKHNGCSWFNNVEY